MHIEAVIFVSLIVTAYLIGKKNINRLVERIGRERNIATARIQYVNAVLSIIFTIIAVTASGMIIGVGLKDLGVLFGSFFAVLGVALFAQWSILSNITASVIVFFFFPYRVGNTVKILDGDNTVEGTIKEISLFHVILKSSENTLTTFPNALVFQRAVIIGPAIVEKNTTPASPAPISEPNDAEKAKLKEA